MRKIFFSSILVSRRGIDFGAELSEESSLSKASDHEVREMRGNRRIVGEG
jgi:hypothetical protein